MRFEIRAGGGVLILFGLVGLSGAVFALGLVAGYEMARQSQPDMSQISSTYPLPNPPENPAPVSEMSPAAEASRGGCCRARSAAGSDKTARARIRRNSSRGAYVASHCRARETAAGACGCPPRD